MAEPVPFQGANHNLLPPSGDNDCMELPVYKGKSPRGETFYISCWKLTKPELEELLKTGKVYVFVYGGGHPPIAISAEDPFT